MGSLAAFPPSGPLELTIDMIPKPLPKARGGLILAGRKLKRGGQQCRQNRLGARRMPNAGYKFLHFIQNGVLVSNEREVVDPR